MKIEQLHALFLESSGIATDTRKIEENTLFFALKGDNFNGNSFAEKALETGAAYAIIDEEEFNISERTILVKNVLQTLQELANFHRKYLGIPIIALTGSNGKTTTKELINQVLSKKFKTVATIGNLNNHIGVPLTLLKMNASTELGIVEMGANHLKEIDSLARIAEPNYGYITNFGKAHLEGFGSEEGVILGKSELYHVIKENGGLLFINGDDPKQVELSKTILQYSFGTGSTNNLKITYPVANPYAKVEVEGQTIQSQLIGHYNATNIAAAVSMGYYFEVPIDEISEAISSYIPANNRSQIIKKENQTIILDAYNANPTSMEAALMNFSQLDAKSKVVFLGDMFELGATAEKEHQYITQLALSKNFEAVVLLGSNFSKNKIEAQNVYYFENFQSLKDQGINPKIKEHLEDAQILIKGSRGMALERILDIL